MSRHYYCAVLFLIVFSSCLKTKNQCPYIESKIVADTSQTNTIQRYLVDNNITGMLRHVSGAFYKINNAGSGNTPWLCNNITVNYSAYIMGYATPFDNNTSASGVSFVLGNLIPGIQKLAPMLRPGGSITMYIPPALAYGSNETKDQNGNVVLPANSYLRFDMSLIAVK
jgi:FKBP-type peptidyl-prolyl cis-trans isomerase FkpA